MAKRTKRDLEAEVEALKARVAEQSAVIARLVAAPYAPAWPQYIPYPVPQPCTRPHYDLFPYIPYVTQPFPVYPTYPTIVYGQTAAAPLSHVTTIDSVPVTLGDVQTITVNGYPPGWTAAAAAQPAFSSALTCTAAAWPGLS